MFIVYALYFVEVCSLYAHFLDGFYCKWYWNLSQVFLYLLRWIDGFYSSILCYIDKLASIEESLHPFDEPHLIMILLMNCWILLASIIFFSFFFLSRISVSCSSVIAICNFPFLWYLSGFSCCITWALGTQASVVAVLRLYIKGSAVVYWLSCTTTKELLYTFKIPYIYRLL